MITMIDQIYDRSYARARTQLNAAILAGFARLGSAVGNAFRVLHRIEYDAPWSARTKLHTR